MNNLNQLKKIKEDFDKKHPELFTIILPYNICEFNNINHAHYVYNKTQVSDMILLKYNRLDLYVYDINSINGIESNGTLNFIRFSEYKR